MRCIFWWEWVIRSLGTMCRLRATRDDLAALFITHKIFQILWGPMLAKSTWFRTGQLRCHDIKSITHDHKIKIPPKRWCFYFGGSGWIRTTSGLSQQIYSLPRLSNSGARPELLPIVRLRQGYGRTLDFLNCARCAQ